MQPFSRVLLLSFLALSSLVSGQASAMGIGGYYQQGSEEWKGITYDQKVTGVVAAKRKISQFGLVLDTAVAKDKLFNYRLNIGADNNESKDGATKYQGYSMSHSFGFGIVRNSFVRLWVGPQLRFGYYDKHTNLKDVTIVRLADIGPVIGVNFNVPGGLTASVASGYMWGLIGGEQKDVLFDQAFTADPEGFYVNASVMFRFGEKF